MAQDTSEATYTGYARQSVVRSASGWTVTGGSASNADIVQFGENTGSAQNVTDFGVGFAETGPGRLLFSDGLTGGTKEVRPGDAPKFAIGDLAVALSGDSPSALLDDLLELIFQNLDAANIGDATGLRGSSAAGNMWISLHTADPDA